MADGLHAERLKPNRDNPREVAFAKQWAHENGWQSGSIIASLLQVPCEKDDPDCVTRHDIMAQFGHHKLPIGPASERDEIIAATIFQWLGSNIGMDALRQSLNSCGYDIVKKE